MKRPIGVTLSAVALGMTAALALLFAALFTFGALFSRHIGAPAATPGPVLPSRLVFVVMLGLAVLMAALTAWALVTIIGLIRLRAWARYSVLAIGGFLVFIGVCSIFGLAIAASVIPATPNVPPSTMHIILIIQALFYIGLTAMGVWWLVFFNLRSTKAYFLPGYADGIPGGPVLLHPPGRFAHVPTSIIVLACILLLSALCCAAMSPFRFPTFLFGFILTGPAVHVLYLTYAALMGLIGWGLLRLDNRARLALYAFAAYGILNFIVILTPWGQARYAAYQQLINSSFGLDHTPASALSNPASPQILLPVAVFCLVLYGIQVWILQHHRSAFTTAPPPRLS